MNKKRYFTIALFFVAIVVLSTMASNTSSLPSLEKKPTIKVAFIWQRWDRLDIPAKLGMELYRRELKVAESKYNINFEVYEFWDNKITGDVQRGKLRKLNIDVVIGPGGFGGWDCPKRYREEIKEFVKKGGGFYGICGDSTFGSLGMINMPRGSKRLMLKILGINEFTPMLGLANVYTDASALKRELRHPLYYNKLDMVRTVLSLFLSRAEIYIVKSQIPIQEPYFGKSVKVMLGNAALVDGPKLNRLFMSKVTDIAIFKGYDALYDSSLKGKKAIIATTYHNGRVILSAPHPELTIESKKMHDMFVRNILWCAKELPETDESKGIFSVI
ncbi:MAG: hypothetical protein U9O49_03625 [Candidatus Thermoplasmatota archaeon]|nr:hypothetical protein [Candidatus Thermoplasmatota archaeon]